MYQKIWTTSIIWVLMRFSPFRTVLCRIVAFIAVYNFFLRVLPTGLSGLRIARTNENEALRNGGFFRLFSWNSDYQKCMRGGKSLLTARRSSLKGSAASSYAGGPKGKRRCDTVFCLMVQCETRRAYIGRDITIGASSLICVVLRKQRHAF